MYLRMQFTESDCKLYTVHCLQGPINPLNPPSLGGIIDLTPFSSPSPPAERGSGGEVDKLNNNDGPPDPHQKEL
jgi:hypothetical protein